MTYLYDICIQLTLPFNLGQLDIELIFLKKSHHGCIGCIYWMENTVKTAILQNMIIIYYYILIFFSIWIDFKI